MHPFAGTPFAFWMTSMAFWSQVFDQTGVQTRGARRRG